MDLLFSSSQENLASAKVLEAELNLKVTFGGSFSWFLDRVTPTSPRRPHFLRDVPVVEKRLWSCGLVL